MNGWDSGAYVRTDEDHVDRYVLFLATSLRAPSLLALQDVDVNASRMALIYMLRLRMLTRFVEAEAESTAFVRVVRSILRLAAATASHAIVNELGDLLRQAARECPELNFTDFVAALFGQQSPSGEPWCAPLQRAVDLTAEERESLQSAYEASRGILDARNFGAIWLGAMVHYATADTDVDLRRNQLQTPQFDSALAPYYITEHAARLIAVLDKNVLPEQAERSVEPFGDRVRLLPVLANAYADQLATYILLTRDPTDRQRLLDLYAEEVNRLADLAADAFGRAQANRIDFLLSQLRSAAIGELTGAVPAELALWFVSGDHRLRYYAGWNYEPRPAVYVEAEQPAIRAMERIYERMQQHGPFNNAEVKIIVTFLELTLLYAIVAQRTRERMGIADILRGEASLRLQMADAFQEASDRN